MFRNLQVKVLCLGICFLFFSISSSTQHDYIHSPVVLQDINFLHTTDTHTWLKNLYGIDWGNYNTFIKNLRDKITSEKDLIVIDTGDKIDGNGIGDATVPKGIVSFEVFNMNMEQMDLLTLGNHELYTSSSSSIEYYTTAKDNEKYVSSNVEFFEEKLNTWVPFGNKYRYFETVNGKKVLALSFLFDFKRFNELARVTSIEDEVKKDWILKELLGSYNDDNIDLLIVFGHLPIQHGSNAELLFLHRFLRKHFKTSIIQYFGGHSHIRDFISIDDKATALQSGRFCETVGFLSLSLDENPNFFRKYLDFNQQSFDYHLNYLKADPIEWSKKNEISKRIDDVFNILQLDESRGYIPDTYYLNNKPLNSKYNLYNLIITEILPKLEKPNGRDHIKRLITVNTGLLRFDLLKGNFTENTKYQVSPFDNRWRSVTIPYHFARHIKEYLNSQSSIALSVLHPTADNKINTDANEQKAFNTRILQSEEITANKRYNLPLGPVTCDDFGCDGEDTLHKPMYVFRMPNVVQYSDIVLSETEEVDFIYLDFFELEVFKALETMSYNGVLKSNKYSASGVIPLLQKHFGLVNNQ